MSCELQWFTKKKLHQSTKIFFEMDVEAQNIFFGKFKSIASEN